MPKRAVKKKMSKLTKGTLVKWAGTEDERGKMSYSSEQWNSLLKVGDIGIILGKDEVPYFGSRSRGEGRFNVYWQRLGKTRSMSFRDLTVEKSLTESK